MEAGKENCVNTDINYIECMKDELHKNIDANDQNIGLFTVQPASKWIEQAKNRPIPKMLFSEFWHEGEVCILFSDTNLGKSILGVQIANSISKGIPIDGFKLEANKQKVLYCDFELSDKQFQLRYSIDYQNEYIFDDSLIRVEINPESEVPTGQTFEDAINISLEDVIISTGVRVLIIDNLTYLRTETEKAREALPLMKSLKRLKNKYNLSILVLAHTPKRDLTKPITRNDLQGSKMLINFCDSSFAIGESSVDKSLRYIKMIKVRNTDLVYDSDNVCICQIEKPENFLHFKFINYGVELEHLRQITEREKTDLENSVREWMDADPDMSAYAIAKKLCDDNYKFPSFKVKISRIYNKIKDSK